MRPSKKNETVNEELKSIVTSLEEEIKQKETLKETQTHHLMQQKIDFNTAKEKENSIILNYSNLKYRHDEQIQLLEDRGADLQNFDRQKAELEMSIEKTSGKIKEFSEKQLEINFELETTQEDKNKIATELLQKENELRSGRETLTSLQKELRDFEVKLNEASLKKENLHNYILNEYSANLEELYEKEEKVYDSKTDWTEVENRILILRKKLSEIGPVNLMAIEEHDELQTRYDFLSKQQHDLINAKEDLLKAISKINTTTQELLAETFQKIRENFREIFVKLFGGGKADLYLTDKKHILESGIDIVAKPPGKKTQNISLLSGGERSMVAVALLFSIYKVKPSPFCLLDEIDAALDEANINRFVSLLKDYTQNSQFIVITHNKKTIAASNALYGITMEDAGISKVVSVKFITKEKEKEVVA